MLLKALFAFLAVSLSSSSLILECDYRMSSWIVIGAKYTCHGTLIAFGTATLNIYNVSGQHLDGRTNNDVEFVNMVEYPNVTRIASNLEKFFPNLTGLRWLNGSLTWIDPNDLKPFPNLQSLSFRGNELVSLDGDLLQFNRNLRYISFRYNRLENIGHDFLTGLNSLEQVIFSYNPCTNAFASTPSTIEALNLQLPISCPPLPRTTITIPEECSDGCLIRIDLMEQEIGLEIASLKRQIEELRNEIGRLKNTPQ